MRMVDCSLVSPLTVSSAMSSPPVGGTWDEEEEEGTTPPLCLESRYTRQSMLLSSANKQTVAVGLNTFFRCHLAGPRDLGHTYSGGYSS